jgi:hypothetical protein
LVRGAEIGVRQQVQQSQPQSQQLPQSKQSQPSQQSPQSQSLIQASFRWPLHGLVWSAQQA